MNTAQTLDIILAKPRGFCAGVERAISIVEKALAKYGPPIYVKHEIVHNEYVVNNLRQKGAHFIEDLNEAPQNSIIIYSAHGVSEQVERDAEKLGLDSIDATCPLVTKVHLEAKKHEAAGRIIILVGHKGHPEVEGTMGRVKGPTYLVENTNDVAKLDLPADAQIAYVTQTTLSVFDTKDIVEALKAKFPNIIGPGTKDICYATQNRQEAVKQLSTLTDMVLVIGSKTSSNSNRLRDLAEKSNTPAYLINSAKDLDHKWLSGIKRVGITAGASAPEVLLEELLAELRKTYTINIREIEGVDEKIRFNLPKQLR